MPTPPDPGSPGRLRRAPAALIVLAATALLVGAVIALVDERDASPPAAAGAGGPDAVTISDFSFTPADLTVPAGATVTWTNDDDFAHTVTSSDGLFDSGELAGGQTFEFTFTEPGTYPYVCNIHPNMTATVTVEAS
jgi:plastocyanin